MATSTERRSRDKRPDLQIVREADPFRASARVLVASAGYPTHPPRSWFENPNLTQPTPLVVEDDGRVYGHLAAWNVRHIGMQASTKPPRSRSQYGYYRTGSLRTAEGDDVNVGQLTLSGGHAPLRADAASAVRHYDDTASAVADLAAGEDAHGIWLAGGLRPGVTSDQIRVLRASPPSGDWRPINGNLELVAACCVNVQGFPTARALAASGGEILALVAAGAQDMMLRKYRQADAEVLGRVAELESIVASMQATQDRALLRMKVHGLSAAVTADKRHRSAKAGHTRGKAGEDEAFPIDNAEDLKNAIASYGRSPTPKTKQHIISRAKTLGLTKMLPDGWKSDSH